MLCGKDGEYKWLGRFPELVDLRFIASGSFMPLLKYQVSLDGLEAYDCWCWS